MRTLFVALILAGPLAAQTVQVPRADPAPITGPRSVSVAPGETTTFTLKTTATLQWSGRIGHDVFTATSTTVPGGLQFAVTGTALGIGHLVVVTDRVIEVEVVVTGVRPTPVPPVPNPTPDPTPVPPTPGPTPDPTPPTPVPPTPTPPTPVPPTPTPTPTKLWGIVIIEETADAVGTRGAFLADKAFADYRAANGLKFRVVDKDVVGADGKPPADVVPFLNDAKAKALPMVYLVDLKGKTVHSEPVPATPAAMIALLKQWSTQ